MLQGSGWPLALYYYKQFGINVGSSRQQQQLLLLKAKVKWPTFWVFCINFLVPPSPNFCCSDWLSRLFGLIFAATCCCLRLFLYVALMGKEKGSTFDSTALDWPLIFALLIYSSSCPFNYSR